MDERVSNKISRLQFVCSLMIIGLHTAFAEYFDVESAALLQINGFVRNIYDAAISTFFFLAAYLLYRNAEQKSCYYVYKRRIWSLVIPHILWNAVYYAHKLWREYAITGMIKESPTLKIVLLKLTVQPRNYILWFILTLLGFVVFFPVIRWAIRLKWPAWIAGVLAVVAALMPRFPMGYTSMLYWLPVYLAGAGLGYWHHERMERLPLCRHKWLYVLCAAALAAMALLRPLGSAFHYLYWLPAALILWVLGDALSGAGKLAWWMKASFYLYTSHMVVQHYAVEIYLRLLGTGTVSYLLCHVLLPCVCAAVALIGAAIVRKLMPRVFELFTGMRSYSESKMKAERHR